MQWKHKVLAGRNYHLGENCACMRKSPESQQRNLPGHSGTSVLQLIHLSCVILIPGHRRQGSG